MTITKEMVALVETERTACTDTGGLGPLDSYEEWRRARSKAFDGAVDRLQQAGAVIRLTGPDIAIKLGGLRATSTTGLEGALSNWLRVASRRLAEVQS